MGLFDIIERIANPIIDFFEPIGEGVANGLDAGFRTVNQVMSDPRAAAAVVISIAAPGIGTTIGNAILGSVGVTASTYPIASAIIGNTVVNGILTGQPEQALKNSIAAAVAPQLGFEAGKFFDNPSAAKLVNDMTSAAAAAAIEGKNQDDILKAMASAGIANAGSYVIDQLGIKSTSPEIRQSVLNAANSALQGEGNLGDRLKRGLMSGAITYGVSQIDIGGVKSEKLTPGMQNLITRTLEASIAGKPASGAVINATVQNLNNQLRGLVQSQQTIIEKAGAEKGQRIIDGLVSSLTQTGGFEEQIENLAYYTADAARRAGPVGDRISETFYQASGRFPTETELASLQSTTNESTPDWRLWQDVDKSVLGDNTNADISDQQAIRRKVFGDRPDAVYISDQIADPNAYGGKRIKTERELLADYQSAYDKVQSDGVSRVFRETLGRAPSEQEILEYKDLYDPRNANLAQELSKIAKSEEQSSQLSKEAQQLSDDIFNELKQQFADADPKEIRAIADSAAAETTKSDVSEGMDDIDRFKKALQPGGVQVFTESEAEGLRTVVNQMRAAGISDDVIEEELVKAQSRDPNFSSFLQSRAPTGLGESQGAGEVAGESTGVGERPTSSDYDLTVEEEKPIGSVIAAGVTPTEPAQQRTLIGPGATGGGEGGFRLISVDPNTGTKVYDTGNPDFSVLVLKDNQVKVMSNQTFQLFEPDPTESQDINKKVIQADKQEVETTKQPETKTTETEQSPIKQILQDVLTVAATKEPAPTEAPPVQQVTPAEPASPVEQVQPVTPPVEPKRPPIEPTPPPVEPTPPPVEPATPTAPVTQPALSQQDVQNAINKAVADAQAEGKAGDAALQAGIDKVASDLNVTKDIVLQSVGKSEAQLRQEMQAGQAQTTGQIAQAEKTLRDEIGKLGTDFQSKFDAMSEAQKQEVADRNLQGESLEKAISDVGAQTTKQIGDVKTSLESQIKDLGTATEQQYNNLSDAQKTEVANRIKQGEDLQKAIADVGQAATQKISDVEKTVSTGFESLDKRISDLVASGKSYQEATTQAMTELGGQFAAYKAAQEQAAEDAKKAEEDAKKAEEAKAKSQNLFNLGLSFLGGTQLSGTPLGGLGGQPAGGLSAAPPYPAELKGLSTGTSSGTEFESPLAAFQRLVDPRMAPPVKQPAKEDEMGYFSYGQSTEVDDVLGIDQENPVMAASGGSIVPMMAKGGLSMVHYAGKPRIDFRQGSYVEGPGDGQSDDIPAMLADGEYVFDAEIVSALGNGSNKAGAQLLDKMRQHIRAHKRSGSLKNIPPPSKSPLEYLAMAKKGK